MYTIFTSTQHLVIAASFYRIAISPCCVSDALQNIMTGPKFVCNRLCEEEEESINVAQCAGLYYYPHHSNPWLGKYVTMSKSVQVA